MSAAPYDAVMRVKIGVLEAAAAGADVDPDFIFDVLQPAFREIRGRTAEAQARLDDALAAIERQRAEHERALEHEREARSRMRMRCRARLDEVLATRLAGLQVVEDFDPRGFFVYFLWGDDDQCPLYIGKSTNVLSRLGSHLGDSVKRVEISRVTRIRCRTAVEMDTTEERLIRHYRPPWNKAGIIGRD